MKKHTAWLNRAAARYIIITVLAFAVVAIFRLVVHVNQTTVALSFLALILITAMRWRLTYSVYLSVLCTLLYNFFFLPPLGKLTIADPQNWVTLLAFLGASVLVSRLSDRALRQAQLSEARRQEVERLYEFSQQILLHEDLRSLARSTPSIVAAVFGFTAVALYVCEGDTAYYSDPGNALLPSVDLKQIAQTAESGIRVVEGARIVPLLLGMRTLGALAISDDDYPPGMYEAIGGLVALALERTAALERSSRMEASREGERLRSALLDSVTHDLRTPLTAIRAAATMLVSQPDLPEAERQEMAAVVDEESARLDKLIGQAVEMAQLDAAAIQVNVRPQSLRELIDLVLEEARSLVRDRNVDVGVPESLPLIPMDKQLVRRVLRHLVENAVKYSPAGSPIAISGKIDNSRLLITVRDEGPGIQEAEQPFIFEKFFRGTQQRQRVQGTGMGLAIVKAILRAHGGGIEVKSSIGHGTAFTFWIPLEEV